MTNKAREALTRAVNRAIEQGAPVYINQPAPVWHVSYGSGSGYAKTSFSSEETARKSYLFAARHHHDARIWHD